MTDNEQEKFIPLDSPKTSAPTGPWSEEQNVTDNELKNDTKPKPLKSIKFKSFLKDTDSEENTSTPISLIRKIPTHDVKTTPREEVKRITTTETKLGPGNNMEYTENQENTPIQPTRIIKQNSEHTDRKVETNPNDSIDLSQPWNTLLSLQLKKIGEKAIAYKWLHNHESNYYGSCEKNYSRVEMILQAVIGTLTGGSFIVFVSELNSGGIVVAVYAILIFLMLAFSIVYGMRSSGNYIALSNEHKYISTKFNELYLQIQGQFIMPVKKRTDGNDFYAAVSRDFNNYMFAAPDVRKSTEKLYLAACGNGDIYTPIILGGLEQVEIVINSNKSTDIRIHSNKDEPEEEEVAQEIPQGTNRAKTHQKLPSLRNINDNDTNYNISYEINRWLKHF